MRKDEFPLVEKIRKEAYQQGRAEIIPFVNEIILLCREDEFEDSSDSFLKEVLCRKLLKYGFIKEINGEYVLKQIKETE